MTNAAKLLLKRLLSVEDAIRIVKILVFINLFISIYMASALLIGVVHADTVKIAIIDSGYHANVASPKLKLCPKGHFDFTVNKPGIHLTENKSGQNHGTNIANIIAEQLQSVDYCVVVYQVLSRSGNIETVHVMNALAFAKDQGVQVASLSMAGRETSISEREAFKRFTSTGAMLFAAAGNDEKNLDYACDVFPACYDVPNLKIVGALDPKTNKVATYSNRGSKVHLWFPGNYQKENGTSYAVPRALSAYVLSHQK